MAAAIDGLASAKPETREAVAAFAERYTLRGRSPAHDWTEPQEGIA
jgi:hypothetical protein